MIDMSGPYKSLAKTLFPKAKIIADRYHIVRQVIWAFENVRKNEQAKFHDTRKKYFKQSRKLLLKRPESLSEEEAAQVAAMLNVSERLRQAYRMKNEFHKLMECKSREEEKKQFGI